MQFLEIKNILLQKNHRRVSFLNKYRWYLYIVKTQPVISQIYDSQSLKKLNLEATGSKKKFQFK